MCVLVREGGLYFYNHSKLKCVVLQCRVISRDDVFSFPDCYASWKWATIKALRNA